MIGLVSLTFSPQYPSAFADSNSIVSLYYWKSSAGAGVGWQLLKREQGPFSNPITISFSKPYVMSNLFRLEIVNYQLISNTLIKDVKITYITDLYN